MPGSARAMSAANDTASRRIGMVEISGYPGDPTRWARLQSTPSLLRIGAASPA
jgi:hypothetical protein